MFGYSRPPVGRGAKVAASAERVDRYRIQDTVTGFVNMPLVTWASKSSSTSGIRQMKAYVLPASRFRVAVAAPVHR